MEAKKKEAKEKKAKEKKAKVKKGDKGHRKKGRDDDDFIVDDSEDVQPLKKRRRKGGSTNEQREGEKSSKKRRKPIKEGSEEGGPQPKKQRKRKEPKKLEKSPSERMPRSLKGKIKSKAIISSSDSSSEEDCLKVAEDRNQTSTGLGSHSEGGHKKHIPSQHGSGSEAGSCHSGESLSGNKHPVKRRQPSESEQSDNEGKKSLHGSEAEGPRPRKQQKQKRSMASDHGSEPA